MYLTPEFYMRLGIRHVGETIAKTIAKKIVSIDAAYRS